MIKKYKSIFNVSNIPVLLILLIILSCQRKKESSPNNPKAEIFPGTVDTTAQLPQGFKQAKIVSGLLSPDAMNFAPDGRLLIAERIKGEIRVVTQHSKLLPKPMVKLNVPTYRKGHPTPQNTGGLRDFVFDPNYPEEPYIYVFYMTNKPRQNRVSRFRISRENPNHAIESSENVLIKLPYNDTGTSGSHTGGALIFGEDGKLYITTGDGWFKYGRWPAGDPVQSLKTFTGKVFRINKDGTIPETNPFFDKTTGRYRAIYALGFRNPVSMSKNPVTKDIYINDVSLVDAPYQKDLIFKLAPGANYMWPGGKYRKSFDTNHGPSIGTPTQPITHAGSRVITGGAWYPQDGYFPSQYQGNYFVTLWGGNNPRPGKIIRMVSRENNNVKPFLRSAGVLNPKGEGMNGMNKPIYIKVGPDGNLYWLATTYNTTNGCVFKISYTGKSHSK